MKQTADDVSHRAELALLDMRTLTETPNRHERTIDRTILFTDVVGSTEELERRGVGDWAEAVDDHRLQIEAVVSPLGGSITSFTGDGFMVSFSDAAAGVRAALQLQETLWEQHELSVRIGLASGKVLPMPSGNFLGLSVNQAARLCDACRPGEVLIGEHSYRMALGMGLVPSLPVVRLRLRGFATPVVARCSLALIESEACAQQTKLYLVHGTDNAQNRVGSA